MTQVCVSAFDMHEQRDKSTTDWRISQTEVSSQGVTKIFFPTRITLCTSVDNQKIASFVLFSISSASKRQMGVMVMFSLPMFFENNCPIDEKQQNECLTTLSYSEKYISLLV